MVGICYIETLIVVVCVTCLKREMLVYLYLVLYRKDLLLWLAALYLLFKGSCDSAAQGKLKYNAKPLGTAWTNLEGTLYLYTTSFHLTVQKPGL